MESILNQQLQTSSFEELAADIAAENVNKYDHIAEMQSYWKNILLNSISFSDSDSTRQIDLKYNPDNIVDWFNSNFTLPAYHMLEDLQHSSLFQGIDYSPFTNTVIENIRNKLLQDVNLLPYIGLIKDIIPGKVSYILFDNKDRNVNDKSGILFYVINDEFHQIDTSVDKILLMDTQDSESMLLYLKENKVYLFEYGTPYFIGNLYCTFDIKDMKLVEGNISQLALLDTDGNLHIMDINYVELHQQIVDFGILLDVPVIDRDINTLLVDKDIKDFCVIDENKHTYVDSIIGTRFHGENEQVKHIIYLTNEGKLYYNYERTLKGINQKWYIKISTKLWRSINSNILVDKQDNYYYINFYRIIREINKVSYNVVERHMTNFFKQYQFDKLTSATGIEIKQVLLIKNSGYDYKLFVLDVQKDLYAKHFASNDALIPFTDDYENQQNNSEENLYIDYSGMNTVKIYAVGNHSTIIMSMDGIVEVPYEHYVLQRTINNILYDRVQGSAIAYIRYDKPYIYICNIGNN